MTDDNDRFSVEAVVDRALDVDEPNEIQARWGIKTMTKHVWVLRFGGDGVIVACSRCGNCRNENNVDADCGGVAPRIEPRAPIVDEGKEERNRIFFADLYAEFKYR